VELKIRPEKLKITILRNIIGNFGVESYCRLVNLASGDIGQRVPSSAKKERQIAILHKFNTFCMP